MRVFCFRRMTDWNHYLVEKMGAYKFTRHATTGFSPYMLTRGTEKAIALTSSHPEFATQSIESHQVFVSHFVVRQPEIHDLVHRKPQQTRQHQKWKHGRTTRANAYEVGEPAKSILSLHSSKRITQAEKSSAT